MIEEKITIELKKLIKKAVKSNETPVAAIITYEGKIIAKAYNKRNKSNITTDHAEIIAIKQANKKIKSWRLNKCMLYTTLEPCQMCENVIKESRISNVFYLIERNNNKNQYNKTNFKKLTIFNNETEKFACEYKKIIGNFFKNKR
jgi:tRNA(adenine34) deaminase